jgi:hypothetical protein
MKTVVDGARMDSLTFAKTWEGVKGEKLTVEPLGLLAKLHGYSRVFEGQALLGELQNKRYLQLKPEAVVHVIARGAV